MAKGSGFDLAPDAPWTFPAWIRQCAAVGGDKAAVDVNGITRTYAELDDVTDRTAAGFAALGLQPGEHVSLMMLNSVENVDAWFGLQKAGLVEVPVHTASRGTALRYIVDHADARALVIDEAFLPHLAGIADGLPRLEHVIVNRNEPGDGDPPALPGRLAAARPREPLRGRRPDPDARPAAAGHGGDPALVRHDRAAEGRRAVAPRGPPPHAAPRLADGLHERRPAVHGLPAVPQQREVHERVRRPRVRGHRRDGQALPGLVVLGDGAGEGDHRVQLHGRAPDDAAQAAGASRRRRQSRVGSRSARRARSRSGRRSSPAST